MPLSIYSNISSVETQLRLGRTQDAQQKAMSHLASGMRISEAADDPAGLGISVGFDTQVRSFAQAARNTSDGLSLLQTVDGALSQVHGALQRMRELAVQSANGTMGTADRSNIQAEFSQLQTEIQRISASTKFGNIQLLNAASTVTLQVGANNTTADSVAVVVNAQDAVTLKVDTASIGVTTQAASTASIDAIDTAIASVSGDRASLGAQQNRLRVALDNDNVFAKNLGAAVGRIRDADIAMESANLARTQVLAQAGIAVLSQANQAPNMALSLLR
jgi:flagellin